MIFCISMRILLYKYKDFSVFCIMIYVFLCIQNYAYKHFRRALQRKKRSSSDTRTLRVRTGCHPNG